MIYDNWFSSVFPWVTIKIFILGLTEAVKESKISVQDCEEQMLNMIKKYTKKGECCLAGNCVYYDKEFLEKFMPRFIDHLDEKIVDVTTVRELGKRWYRKIVRKMPSKKLTHRALGDIEESIEELRYYKTHIFREIQL